ncbi:MAG: choloylglycine hydrolase [Oscillospiraceae bacterium]|nr:choloylglycine hydrolase [Oscillospiraceae bacterium]
MCTAISYKTQHHYFGRNLDLERGFGEGVVIAPRNYPLSFRFAPGYDAHYAMIGMAAVVDDYPLYFEATNEKGLSVAGLNFPGNAHYASKEKGKINIASFELIPYLLGACDSVEDAEKVLETINIVDCDFSDQLPATPLHWLIGDKHSAITLECTKRGMEVYKNPFGVLTNNPTFDYHAMNVNNYMALHPGGAENRLSNIPLENYSLGMGALGLPGDYSSASRFVKAVFVKENSVCNGSEEESVNQFFHILQSVAMPKGCVEASGGEYEYTRYSCCCNTDTLAYYYTTYDDPAPRRVDMGAVDLEDRNLYLL